MVGKRVRFLCTSCEKQTSEFAILHDECIIKIVQMCIEINLTNDTRFKYINTASNKNQNFMHQNIFITVQFLRNFVQLEVGYSFREILLRVECRNVSKFETYVLNLTPIFRRHLEKNVNKMPYDNFSPAKKILCPIKSRV